MAFRAIARFDINQMEVQEYQKMIAAFMQAGWVYAGTSSVATETENLEVILRRLDICARQVRFAGNLTGLSFDVQSSSDFAGKPYVAAANHPHALQEVRDRPSPV